jgi:hypothetical protein
MKTMQFCQLPGTILRAPSEAAACSVMFNVADGEGSEVNLPGARFTSECVDEYSGVMDRTCEGLMDCVFGPGVNASGQRGSEEEVESSESSEAGETSSSPGCPR